jgi:NADH-quinone oxidoreductase subunit J
MPPLFMFLAALAIIASLGVVLQRNPIHSLLSLVMALLVIALLFIEMGALTVGLLQAIVYAGAIMVLFLFVIWLLNLQREPSEGGHLALKLFGSLGAAALVAELFAIVARGTASGRPMPVTAEYGSIESLAELLFSDYLIAFEITSVLLLAAIVGAVALARRIPDSGLRSSRGETALPAENPR